MVWLVVCVVDGCCGGGGTRALISGLNGSIAVPDVRMEGLFGDGVVMV